MWSLDNLNGNFVADSVEIREVWDSNLEEEISHIRSIIFDYPFVSIDTEFPSISVPAITYTSHTSLNEVIVQLNINHLKLIQLGLTFFNSSGHIPLFGSPPHPCIWQFNFCEFDPAMDKCSSYSMERLRRSNIDLEKNHRIGVTASRFSELFSYGILQNDSLQWITFRNNYDLGYLLKTLTCRNVPHSKEDFNRSLRLYFPKVYDIKRMMRFCNINGELNNVARNLGVNRAGFYHQVGSNSLLTAAVFKKFKDKFFNGSVERIIEVLYGPN